MPIYEYECRQCGKIEEVIQRFSDAPLTTCRHCSGSLSKLVSHSSFHLKGGGWFTDGYGTKSKGDVTTESKGAVTTENTAGKEAGASSGTEKSSDSGAKASE